jgi:ABC-type glycerol-3-phosphate transport system substrate-binding protein
MEARLFTRRGVNGAVAGGAGALLASACGAPAGQPAGGATTPAAAPVTLSFWARGTQEFTDMMASIATAYAGANPSVTMDGGYFPSDGYNDRLVAAAASDTLPDVMYAGGEPDFGAILKVTDFKWGAVPLPLAGAGKPQASFGASTLYSLSPKSRVQAPAWAFLTWIVTQQAPQGILNQAGKLGVPPYRPIYDRLFLQEPRTDVKKVLGEMAGANHPYLEGLTVVPPMEKVFTDELKGVWAGTATAREATRRIADQITPLLSQ